MGLFSKLFGGEEAAETAPEPRRQGPPEQYLPPHLRSEPRLTAAPVHPPQPVLSRQNTWQGKTPVSLRSSVQACRQECSLKP